MRKGLFVLAALGAALLALAIGGAAANLPAGTSIDAAVSSPADHAVLPLAPLTIHGTASVGVGLPVANTTLIYIVDVSGSTSTSTGGTACPRQNVYDALSDTTLDCELLAVRALNAQAISTGTIAKIGFIAFAGTNSDALTNITSAAPLDLDAAGGPAATLVAPNLNNFPGGRATVFAPTSNLDWVVQSAYLSALPLVFPGGWGPPGVSDGFTLFTPHDVGTATNYYAPLQVLKNLLPSITTPRTQVVFLSDGLPNQTVQSQPLATVLSQLHPTNTILTIDTFAVIGAGSTCGTASPTIFGSLEQISAAYGKHCTALSNPQAAVTAVPAVIASQLTAATLKVDGAPIPTVVGPPGFGAGPRTVPLTSSTPQNLTPGDHRLCAFAGGQDGGGTGSTTDADANCVTITIKAPPSIDLGGGDGPNGTVGSTPEGSPFNLGATVTGATTTAWSSSGGTGSCSFGDASVASTTVTCTDDGIYTLTLTATDEIGQVRTATEHLEVTNVAPAATLTITSPPPHPLATPVSAHVAITDPGADTFTCTFNWGEGAPDSVPAAGNSCDAAHVFGTGGAHTVTVTVTDDDTGTGGDSATVVIDAPPIVDLRPSSGTEGSPIALTATASDDNGITSKSWSITGGTGTCAIADASAASTTATCTDDGGYTATLIVSDGVNPPVSTSTTLTAANVAPSVVGTPIGHRVALNAPTPVSFTFTDPGSGDTHTCSIAWGDGVITTGTVDEAAHTCTGSHAYGVAGTYAATATVTDDDSGAGSAAVSVEVVAPPVVTIGSGAGGIATTDEGTAFVLNAAATGLAGLTVHWSSTPSGSGGSCSFGNAAAATTTVTCNDNGTFTLTLTATDGVNAPVQASLELHVANVAPGLSLTSTVSGLTVTVTGSVSDAGSNDTQTCSFAWGDGATTAGIAVTGGTCQSSHTYAAGTPTASITVTATDDDGGSTQQSLTRTLNRAPSCTAVTPSLTELWPPNHTLQLIVLGGATDPDGDPLAYAITSVRQDEPTNGLGDGDTAVDAVSAGPGMVRIRAERSGNGDGRVYTIRFTVSDGKGGSCAGSVNVTVPKSASKPAVLTPGPGFDSFH